MIADMYQAGYSCNRIAQELGRDYTSIGEFIRRNHIRKSRPGTAVPRTANNFTHLYNTRKEAGSQ